MTIERECILIVEDHLAMRGALRSILEDEGYRVLTAAEGRSALIIVQDTRPDLILSDLRMPVMDGFALCRAVRGRRDSASTPFILVTAERELGTAKEARRIGVDVVLPKPFDPYVLLTAIRTQLSQASGPGFRRGAPEASSMTRREAGVANPARESPVLHDLGIQ